MEKIEGWDPHPTRKNIYINQKDWKSPLVPIIKFLMGYSWRVQKIMSKIK